MPGETDNKDRNASRKIAIALVSLVIVAGIVFVPMFPTLSEIVSVHFSPGLDLKSSAVLSFSITTVLMIVFAVVSGDGLLGEIQFILGGFFLFFVLIWLLLAWIF